MRVVFDFGGVLFRWRPAVPVARAWPHRARTAAMLKQTLADCFQAYGGDWGDFDLGLIGEVELAQRMAARTGWPADEIPWLLAAVRDELRVQPAVLALLLQLRSRGVPLSFLSNMPAPLAATLAERNPLHEWFESGVFSGHEHIAKPAPALFELAARRYGSAPKDCLLIDDHPANVEAAKACGWQAELFTNAATLQAQLRARALLK
jgi:putative hydrolase of the HAD superfamily